MKVSIHAKAMIVKYTFGDFLWYTDTMNIPDSTKNIQTNEHAAHCTDRDQYAEAMRRAIHLLGDMWTLMIVYQLLEGEKRFGELLESMGQVSPRTVSQRLKMLEESDFVHRQAFAEIPPRVEYRLTEKGLALADIIKAIGQFAEQHLMEGDAVVPPSSPCP